MWISDKPIHRADLNIGAAIKQVVISFPKSIRFFVIMFSFQ